MNTTATFSRCLTYLETQIGPQSARPSTTRAPTITLSRMTGSGGIDVADKLAEILQARRPAQPAPWTVFHAALIEKVIADHHLPKDFSKFMPENRVSYIEDTLEELFGLHPSSSAMITQIAETILRLAELGNCILVGRGAHVVLARLDSVLSVRLIGSLERRIQRVAGIQKIEPEQAREFIRTEDGARRRYLKTYFDSDIADPLNYDLVLNTDDFGVDGCAEVIAGAVMTRFPKGAERATTRNVIAG